MTIPILAINWVIFILSCFNMILLYSSNSTSPSLIPITSYNPEYHHPAYVVSMS